MTNIKEWIVVFKERLEKGIVCEKISSCIGSVEETHFIMYCMDQIGKTKCGLYKVTALPSEWLTKVQELQKDLEVNK